MFGQLFKATSEGFKVDFSGVICRVQSENETPDRITVIGAVVQD